MGMVSHSEAIPCLISEPIYTCCLSFDGTAVVQNPKNLRFSGRSAGIRVDLNNTAKPILEKGRQSNISQFCHQFTTECR